MSRSANKFCQSHLREIAEAADRHGVGRFLMLLAVSIHAGEYVRKKRNPDRHVRAIFNAALREPELHVDLPPRQRHRKHPVDDGDSFVIGTSDLMIRASAYPTPEEPGIEVRGVVAELLPNFATWGHRFRFRGTREELSSLACRGAQVMGADPRFLISGDAPRK